MNIFDVGDYIQITLTFPNLPDTGTDDNVIKDPDVTYGDPSTLDVWVINKRNEFIAHYTYPHNVEIAKEEVGKYALRFVATDDLAGECTYVVESTGNYGTTFRGYFLVRNIPSLT